MKDDLYYEIMDYICSYFEENLTEDIKYKYLHSSHSFSYTEFNNKEITMSGYGFNNSSIKKHRLGYSPNSGLLYKKLIEKFGVGILDKYMINGKLLGLFNKGKNPLCFFKNRIVFPIIVEGRVVAFTSRQTEYSPKDKLNSNKFLYMCEPRRFFFNEDNLDNEYDNIFITEGIADAISLEEHGYNAIAIGTTDIPIEMRPRIFKALKYKNVYILLDNETNKSGDKGAKGISSLLNSEGIYNVILNIPLPDGEDKIDINEYFKYNYKEDFMKLIGYKILNN